MSTDLHIKNALFKYFTDTLQSAF